MRINLVTLKLANELLIFIYKKYKKENGEGIARLKFADFRVDDPIFIDFVRNNSSVEVNKEVDILLSNLLMELHERKFIVKRNMIFTLSVSGVNQAVKLLHPVMYFIVNKWAWYVPIVIGLIFSIIKLK